MPIRRPVGVSTPRHPAVGSGPQVHYPAAVIERGPQGAPGTAGEAFYGYGYIQYVEASTDVGAVLLPSVRAPLSMTIDPLQTTDALAGVFKGFPFFDGSLLHARALGDAYDIRFTMTVTAQVAGGSVTVDATINGLTTLTDSDTATLSAPAGQGQRIAFRLKLFPKAVFLSNGVRLFVTSSVGAVVTSESLVVEPLSVKA
jgi:hypothetical protein